MKDIEPIDELEELIAGISARPVMYAGENRFLTAMAFLCGCATTREEIRGSGEWKTLSAFGLWLAKKLDKPSNWAWFAILHDFCGNDDKLAFENLPKLFREFRQSEGL